MFANNLQNDRKDHLIKTLTQLPSDWVLTPLLGNKAPYRSSWQSEEPLLRDAIAEDIRSGKAQGFGIRTGIISGGVVAVDQDGPSAAPKILEMSGGVGLPKTVSFTSRRPGRSQHLFKIPEEYWFSVKTTKYKTGTTGDDGKPEQVELRWNGCQSVLPPSIHPTTGGYIWLAGCAPWECEIANTPQWLIELMLNEPAQDPAPEHRTNSKWTDKDRALSYLKALSPSRVDDYDAWVKVGMALHSVSDSLLSEWDRWSRQSQKYKDGACEKKWKSFKSSGVSIGSLAHMAKQDGWRGPTEVSLRDRVLEILNRNPSISDRKGAFIELSKSTGVQVREVEHLADAIESEIDLTEGRTDRTAQLKSLLKIGDRRLTLSRYLHHNLAQPLERLAGWMGIDPEALLTVLLPTAASLLHPETRVIVKECIDFIEPMVFYTGVVSESGNRKSPTFKVITKALRKFQTEEETNNKLAQKQYQADLSAWKQDSSEDRGDEPEPPEPLREYFVDNITSEALDRIKAQQPDHGILIRKDELSGLFGSYGAYKGGRGGDKEGILSGWNGEGVKVNRAGGSRLSLSHDASSIVGAIQPGKLRKVMGDLEDEQGEWGRFLWYFAPLRAFRLPDDDTRFEVGELLEGIYRKLDKLAPIQYRFTPEAKRVYQDYHWQLEERKLAEPRQGMRAAIAKMQGYTARIAGILHILWETASGKTPEVHIPIERVNGARHLAEFYLGQVVLIHSDAEAANGELTPILNSILKKARQLGQLSTRNAQSSIKALRSYKSDKTLVCFRELAAMGYATVDGKNLIPKVADQNADRADHLLTNLLTGTPTAVSTDNRSSQPFKNKSADFADPADHFLQKSSQSGVVEDDSLNTGQQSQQVSTLDETLTESDADPADRESASGSAKVADEISPNAESVDEWLAPKLAEADFSNSDLLPTVPTKDEAVQRSASMLCDLADSITSYAMLTDIILGWGHDYLRDVWHLLPVELQRKFALLSAAPSDDGDDDPDGGGSGNQPVAPAPTPGDDGGDVVETQPQEPPLTDVAEEPTTIAAPATTPAPVVSQQMTLALPLLETQPVEVTLPQGVEWLDATASEFEEQRDYLLAAPKIVLDLETFQPDVPKKGSTPNALHPWQSRIRLVQLSTGDRTFIADFGGRDSDAWVQVGRNQPIIKLLRQIVQNPEIQVISHNAIFDLSFLAAQYGIRGAKNICDTMLGAQVFYGDYGSTEEEKAKQKKHDPILTGGYSLENLAHRFLDITLNKSEQKSDWGSDLTSEQIRYAATDPQITLQVYKHLNGLYKDETLRLYSEGLQTCWQLENEVVACAIEIELAGLPLDADAAKQQLATIESYRQPLLEEWANLCPDLKYTQRDKLLDHLNQKYQLGLTSLDKSTLDKKSRENPLIQIRLKLQGLDALANNLKGFLTSAARDGRVHTTYKTLTGTGRFSSGGGASDLPNLQAIKAKSNPVLDEFKLPSVREVIRPRPGRTMAVIDLAGAHGRIAADQTEDETAIAGNNDPSIDNHSKVAVFIAKAQGFDWTWEDIAKVRKDKANPDSARAGLFRDTAKNTYYGWLNGAGAKRIQEQITANTGITPAMTECEAAIEGCKALYPGVLQHRRQLMERLRIDAVDVDGRPVAVNKTSDGFRVCMPLVPNPFNKAQMVAPYAPSLACIWSRIEATAVKRALIQIMDVREQHPEWNLDVINYVHDEIDIEVDTEFASVAVPLVNNIIGDCFAAQLKRVNDGRETNWEKLVVGSWADK